MTKLTRVTAKIFGDTADATLADPEIGQFGSAKAGTYNATADVATIQGLTAWSNGWIDAVTPTQQFPPLPEMTGVHKVLSYQEAYLLQQGIAEWDSATTYYENNFCAKGDKVYVSLSDSNTNNDPSSDTVNWIQYGGANQDLSNLSATGLGKFVQRAGDTMSGDLGIKKSSPAIVLDNTSITLGTTPSANQSDIIRFRDGTGQQLGSVYHVRRSAGSMATVLLSYNANGTDTSSVSVGFDESNNLFTYAPACSVNNSILTTVAHTFRANTNFSYAQLGNGNILQWGKVSPTSDNQTYTWTKAFSSSTSYTTFVTQINWSNSSGDNIAITSQTATGFTIRANSTERASGIYVFAIGY